MFDRERRGGPGGFCPADRGSAGRHGTARSISKTDAGWEPREAGGPYNAHFGIQNAVISRIGRLKETIFIDIAWSDPKRPHELQAETIFQTRPALAVA